MSIRLAITLFVLNTIIASPPANAGSLGAQTTPPSSTSAATSVRVIEFYHKGLDHYFMTASPVEIAALEDGGVRGWVRTGHEFRAFASTSPGANLSPVCRLYGRPDAGLDSHFYSGTTEECASAYTKFASTWLLESHDVFRIQMPDRLGACPAATIPVYRVFNNRSDANHRYTTDAHVRDSMLLKGAVPEGYGTQGVVFCADSATTGDPAAPPPISVSILATQLESDMFAFSSSVTAAIGATIAYAWSFGDGGTDVGATASHRFAAPGTYSVVLTVTDDKGNTSSAARIVTAAAPPGPGTTTPPPEGKSDFDARKTAPGVVRWFDFDTAAQLGGTYQANFGRLGGRPVIDTAVKASGAGSIRFDVASQTTDDTHAWFANFSPTLEQFGAGETFYVQWRQRFNQAFVDTRLLMEGGETAAIKQAIIGAGSFGTDGHGTSSYATSCSANELVVTSGPSVAGIKYPTMYHHCGVSNGLYENPWRGDPSNFGLQNAMPAPYCQYTGLSGCFRWVANEWMTFKLRVSLGPIVGGKYTNSIVQLWGARDGQPSKLLVDWKPTTPGYFPLNAVDPSAPGGIVEYGKVWLLPYMTAKSRTQVHPLLQTWYDDLIISRQDIADPAGAAPTPTPVPPSIAALPANTALDLGVFRPLPPVGDTALPTNITDFSGARWAPSIGALVLFGGGHASTNADPVYRFPAVTLKWEADYLPTPKANWTIDNYDFALGAWKSGPSGPYPRAAARHTIGQNVIVGDELVVMAKVEGNYPNLVGDWSKAPRYVNGVDHYADTMGRIGRYNLKTKTWRFSPLSQLDENFPASAVDPVSGKVVSLGSYMLWIYDPANEAATKVFDVYVDGMPIRDEAGQPAANGLSINANMVYYPPTDAFYYIAGPRVYELKLNRTDYRASRITLLTTTGTPPPSGETAIAHDAVNKVILVGPIANTVYAFDPRVKHWESKVVQGGTPGSVQFHAGDFVPDLNAYIFIGSGSRSWVYRWATGAQ